MASRFTNDLTDALPYEHLSAVFLAILEAKILHEEIITITKGELKPKVDQLLNRIESEKFKSVPSLKQYLQSQLETQLS